MALMVGDFVAIGVGDTRHPGGQPVAYSASNDRMRSRAVIRRSGGERERDADGPSQIAHTMRFATLTSPASSSGAMESSCRPRLILTIRADRSQRIHWLHYAEYKGGATDTAGGQGARLRHWWHSVGLAQGHPYRARRDGSTARRRTRLDRDYQRVSPPCASAHDQPGKSRLQHR